MEFRDRDEDHVPEPPRGGAPERLFAVPGRELQERLALIPARFILLGRHENRTSAAKKSPAMVFLLWAPAHKLYVCSSGTRAGSDGHRHVRLVRSGIPGGSCRGDREATPGGPPGVEGRCPPAGDEQTSPRQVQAAVRPRDPRERSNRV